jgi:hypothetical protein
MYASYMKYNCRIILQWILLAMWTCVNQEGYERFPFVNGTECTHKTVQTTTNTVEQNFLFVGRVTQRNFIYNLIMLCVSQNEFFLYKICLHSY